MTPELEDNFNQIAQATRMIQAAANRLFEFIDKSKMEYLYCGSCGKCVSTAFVPDSDKGIVIRAYIECPECMVKKEKSKL